ncbi:MAG: type II toxin-antitoxin system PemK/MazF family toxin [Clostridia bacterium]|nr:type II toxin-antitoxin system PemK/MazF family toxin [Clostridia bacterium]
MEEKQILENRTEYINAIAHKQIAVNQIDLLLTYHIENNNLKKANLLSYWFEDFSKYNLNEENFNPKLLKKYKRGSIIKANLGFNVGNEEGGLHYCIVLDKNNALSSGTLTVIPLTSIKENKKYNSSTLNIGNEIYINLKKICDNMSLKLANEYENIWNLATEKVEKFNTEFKNIEKEIAKMKKGSIALISQITTISKQRIYNPKTSSDILANLRVSTNTLNLIDAKIKELFLK